MRHKKSASSLSLNAKAIRLQWLPFLVIFLACSGSVSGQNDHTIRIRAGEDIQSLYREIYQYPQFRYGIVYFGNGDSAASLLNYNYLLGDLQFIGEKGDTLVMADRAAVSWARINDDTFYFKDEHVLRLLACRPPVRLAVLRQVKLADEQSIGAYGIPSSTHAIESKGTLNDFQTHKLQLNKDLVLAKEEHYYFSKGDQPFQQLNKKNLLKAFSRNRKAIESYLEANHVDLKKEPDLLALMGYLEKMMSDE